MEERALCEEGTQSRAVLVLARDRYQVKRNFDFRNAQLRVYILRRSSTHGPFQRFNESYSEKVSSLITELDLQNSDETSSSGSQAAVGTVSSPLASDPTCRLES